MVKYPTNTPRVFPIEMTWKRPFRRRFNVEYTWFVCSVISVKLAVRDVTQLKPRYLYKASKIQSAWDSRINLEFHENEISKLLF